MKDCAGHELEVGDVVAAASYGYVSLDLYQIITITPKRVGLHPLLKRDNRPVQTFYKDPTAVCKTDVADACDGQA